MLEPITAPNGVLYYASPLFKKAGIPHAFSTRKGGVSKGPFDSLNLGNPSGTDLQDSRDHIRTNYDLLQEASGSAGRERCWVHQVHQATVVSVEKDQEHDGDQKADALVTRDVSRVLSVRTADCVPVLLASADGKAVAAIHSGWRGVISGVVPEALKKLKSAGTPGVPIFAAIGPCIGPDEFEVGEEVLQEFTRVFGAVAPIRSSKSHADKGFVDLRAAILLQLRFAGMYAERIDSCDCCTVRMESEFFSHRRDRNVTGRMAALIATAA